MAMSIIRSDRLLLLASALYFFSFSHGVVDEPEFVIEGEVYCDTCRAQFKTRLSTPLSAAAVRLECRNPVDRKMIYTVDGKTDSSGRYSLQVQGDHADQICEVVLVESSEKDCSEISREAWGQTTSRVTLTLHSGITDKYRQANALGFMATKPHSDCIQVYKELDMPPPQGF